MIMLNVIESKDVLEVQSPVPTGKRILFLVFALFPLIAPYELIIKPNWQDYFNIFFLFVFLISVGALAVSAFLVWAAIAGLNSYFRFDRSTRTFIFSFSAPILRMRTVRYPLASIDHLLVETHEWSDGSPSYSFTVTTSDGKAFKSNHSWVKTEIETVQQRVMQFLGL
jgi:hypothetical protein